MLRIRLSFFFLRLFPNLLDFFHFMYVYVFFYVVHNKRCVDIIPFPHQNCLETLETKIFTRNNQIIIFAKIFTKDAILLRKFNELKFKMREKKVLHYLPDRINCVLWLLMTIFCFFVNSMAKLSNISRTSAFSRTNRKRLPFPPYSC